MGVLSSCPTSGSSNDSPMPPSGALTAPHLAVWQWEGGGGGLGIGLPGPAHTFTNSRFVSFSRFPT